MTGCRFIGVVNYVYKLCIWIKLNWAFMNCIDKAQWKHGIRPANTLKHIGTYIAIPVDSPNWPPNCSLDCGVSVGPLSGVVISGRPTWNHRIDADCSPITAQTIVACQLWNRTVTLDVISLHSSDKTILHWPFVFIKNVAEPAISYNLKLKTWYPFTITVGLLTRFCERFICTSGERHCE